MPRRLPVRPAKLIGNLFVLAALTLIFTIYYVYVGVLMGPRAVGKSKCRILKVEINFLKE